MSKFNDHLHEEINKYKTALKEIVELYDGAAYLDHVDATAMAKIAAKVLGVKR